MWYKNLQTANNWGNIYDPPKQKFLRLSLKYTGTSVHNSILSMILVTKQTGLNQISPSIKSTLNLNIEFDLGLIQLSLQTKLSKEIKFMNQGTTI